MIQKVNWSFSFGIKIEIPILRRRDTTSNMEESNLEKRQLSHKESTKLKS